MIKIKRSSLALMVCGALVSLAPAASVKSAKPAEPETIGGFAVKVASALNLAATDQKAAVASLKGAGLDLQLDLQVDLSAPLTEGAVARMFFDLGIPVALTRVPDREVTSRRADQILISADIGSWTLAAGGPPEPIPPPVVCLQERNRGQCQSCCTDATRCGNNPNTISCNVCARFCKAVLPPGQESPSEPQP